MDLFGLIGLFLEFFGSGGHPDRKRQPQPGAVGRNFCFNRQI